MTTVRYFGLQVEPEEAADAPIYETAPDFDSVDMGIEIGLDDGSTFSFAWQTPGSRGQGVLMLPNTRLRDQLHAFRDVAASATRYWADLIGVTVQSTGIGWDKVEGTPGAPLLHSAATAVLSTQTRDAIVTLGEPAADGRTLDANPTSIAVFGNRDTAHHHDVPMPTT